MIHVELALGDSLADGTSTILSFVHGVPLLDCQPVLLHELSSSVTR